MAEDMNGHISRRNTRLFLGEQEFMEAGITGQVVERDSRQVSEEKEQERPQKLQRRPLPENNIEAPIISLVDFETDLLGILPSKIEVLNDHVTKSLHASKPDKSRGEGRPINFGTVLPDAVYRSSFPMTEDFLFLRTLRLKTVISLVKKDFPPRFRAFMKDNGIRHVVIDMQGTKKVKISDAIMHAVMEVALNKANHPLLIHCNHGKHRTGCAVAVIRHVAGWTIDTIIQEYRGFAEPKVRECDLKYIKGYKISSLQDLFTEKVYSKSAALTSSKMCKYTFFTALVLSFWFITILFWGQH